jgi:4'-phosphopantetheinyl transferase
VTRHLTILYYSALPGEAHADGRASRAGRDLARRALGELLGREVAAAELRAVPAGKPQLAGGPDFSISHAGPWVAAVATTEGRIGLDIETEDADRLSLRRVCDACELEVIAIQGAAAMWVAKEAALKAWGLTLREAPRVRVRGATACLDGATLHLQPLARFAGARACVATTAPPSAIEFRELPCAGLGDP